VLTNPRKTLALSLALLGTCVLLLLAVGRHDPAAAPTTQLPFIGVIDAHVHDWMTKVRFGALTSLSRSLNVIGGAIVTAPIRAAALVILLVRRRWRAFAAFALIWVVSQLSLTLLKSFMHRGRPPVSFVTAAGYAMPSGHALSAAATAIALVMVFTRPGSGRLKWWWIAMAFASIMAFSRVYLWAHWLSDTVVGVLLGAGIALAIAAMMDLWFSRTGSPAAQP
jgi:membrane-associated phospholipid phosphatase